MLTSASRSQLTFRVATSVCSMPEANKLTSLCINQRGASQSVS